MTNQRKSPEGILGFPVAPFSAEGKLDRQTLESNIQFLVREGLSAIFICAGSGEFQSLSLKEYEEMVEIAVNTVSGKVPVYTGVGGNVSSALQMAAITQEKGADGYLILPPYLIHGEQSGLYEYYSTIIESTDLNTIIYQRDNAIFTLDTVKRLVMLPQLVGFKDGYGSMELNAELVHEVGSRLGWMNGMPFAEVTVPAYLPLGFNAYSSAISNYIPHISRMFYTALQENNQEVVRELYQNVILPINRVRKLRKGYAVSLIKAGMEIMGLAVGRTVRPPLVPVENEHYHQLETILRHVAEQYPAQSGREVVS